MISVPGSLSINISLSECHEMTVGASKIDAPQHEGASRIATPWKRNGRDFGPSQYYVAGVVSGKVSSITAQHRSLTTV